MSVKRLVELMGVIRDKNVLVSTDGARHSVGSLMKTFHKIILRNFVGDAQTHNLQFSPLNRVISFSELQGGIDPVIDTRELVGMITLNKRYERFSEQVIEDRLGTLFWGLYEDHFFLPQPKSLKIIIKKSIPISILRS